MSFDLSFPVPTPESSCSAEPQQLELEPGQMLFVLGANGTGKSGLMVRFARQNPEKARRIVAHRQIWMPTDALKQPMTYAARVVAEQEIRHSDRDDASRYEDSHAAERVNVAIHELISAVNVRARSMAAAHDADDREGHAKAARAVSPIVAINELFRTSNIPIVISIDSNDRIMASRNGSRKYSVAELSDGERNVLQIAGDVLTAEPGTLLIIDEPERHLHRSIISPLLAQLFETRTDCGFVISTHDYDLPLEFPCAATLLLRSCDFDGQDDPNWVTQKVEGWEVDLLPAGASIDDDLKRDLLGARRNILFVEGTENSLDKSLYSLIFPKLSVVPVGNRRAVKQAVAGCRSCQDIQWVRAFGIVDGDGHSPDEVHSWLDLDVHAVPFYSVEAIYFHPKIIGKIARRQSEVLGDDPAEMEKKAFDAGIKAVADGTERLIRNTAQKTARKRIIEQIPNGNDLLVRRVDISIDGPEILAGRKNELGAAVQERSWESILKMCPVHESEALANISRTLGFQNMKDYRKAVRQLLDTDEDALDLVRGLFRDLFEKLDG